MKRLLSKDGLAGLFFLAFGLAAATMAARYDFGSTARMGPGYFPLVVSWLILGIGALLVTRSLLGNGELEEIELGSARPLILLSAGLVLFALLVERAGIVAAILALVTASRLAGNQFSVREVTLLAAALIIFCVVVFVWALKLPVPVLGR